MAANKIWTFTTGTTSTPLTATASPIANNSTISPANKTISSTNNNNTFLPASTLSVNKNQSTTPSNEGISEATGGNTSITNPTTTITPPSNSSRKLFDIKKMHNTTSDDAFPSYPYQQNQPSSRIDNTSQNTLQQPSTIPQGNTKNNNINSSLYQAQSLRQQQGSLPFPYLPYLQNQFSYLIPSMQNTSNSSPSLDEFYPLQDYNNTNVIGDTNPYQVKQQPLLPQPYTNQFQTPVSPPQQYQQLLQQQPNQWMQQQLFSPHLDTSTTTPLDVTPPDTIVTSVIDDSTGLSIQNGGTISSSSSITLTFEGVDDLGIAEYACILDSLPPFPCSSPVVLDNNIFQSVGINSTGNNAVHTFQVSAIDKLGNTDSSPAVFDWFILNIITQGTIAPAPTTPEIIDPNAIGSRIIGPQLLNPQIIIQDSQIPNGP